MMAPIGAKIVKENADYHSLVYLHVADLDVVSTYPTVSQLLNIARETCKMEFSKMRGISELNRRAVGVNLTGGRINSIEISQKILSMPSMDSLLEDFMVESSNTPFVDGAGSVDMSSPQ